VKELDARLRLFDDAEADEIQIPPIAQVFTEEKGLQSYIISGVRSRKPKVHASLLQPMSMLDMVVYFRPDKTLFRTKEIRSAYNFQRVPFEIQRSAVCLFAAEVLLKVLRESEAHMMNTVMQIRVPF